MQKICETKYENCFVYLMKLDSSENFLGKILHPSKQSSSQIEYNEIKLQCHNVAIIL